jgi:hypothetical protein
MAAMEELLDTLTNVLQIAIKVPEIAKTMLTIMSSIQRSKWSQVPMNTVNILSKFRDLLLEYAREAAASLLPTDIINAQTDIGNNTIICCQCSTILGVSVIHASPSKRIAIGGDAFVEFRREHRSPSHFAVVWMRNGTFYPTRSLTDSGNSGKLVEAYK